ncbi:hypothetical protein EEK96_13725 [Escherichia coli]|nr:hypothetical protein [Escherichia coli]HEI2547122.1 hypothetical protein [Escherichia coli]
MHDACVAEPVRTDGHSDNWHFISLIYQGGSTARASLAVDVTLTCSPSTVAVDTLMLSAITTNTTCNIEVESLSVTVNEAVTG